MSKILITGGAGFIGCNFINYWHEKHPNDELVCIDKLTYAGVNKKEVKDKCEFLHADVRSVCNYEENSFDYIIHFAAETHVDNSIRDADPFIQTNIEGTYELLKFAKANTDLKKFIHISTDEVYGDTRQGGIVPKNTPFDEYDILKPSNPYSASKVAGEALVQSYIRTFGFPAIIVRPSNNYGFYQFEEKFTPKIIKQMIKKKPIHISKNNPMRDWLWVEDTCRAIEILLDRGQVGEIYNVAGNDEQTIENIAKEINRLGGNYSEILADWDRPGEDLRYYINDDKIRSLGFKNEGRILDKLPDMVDFYTVKFEEEKARGKK